MLQFEKVNNEGILELSLEGRLDSITAPQLRAELEADLPEVEEVRFDFAKLKYISSAGIRVLIYAKKNMKHKGPLVIRHPSRQILKIMDSIGVSFYFSFQNED